MAKINGFTITPTYDTIDGKTVILLYGKLSNGDSFVSSHDFKPYFYIKTEDVKKVNKYLSNKCEVTETKLVNFSEEKVTKLSFNTQPELNEVHDSIKKIIQTYEADIRPHYRFLMDNNLLGTLSIENAEDYEINRNAKINRIYKNPEILPAKEDY